MSAGRVKAGQVFVEIGADPRAFFAALNKINRQIGAVGRSVASAGAKLGAIGAGVAAPFAAAAVAGSRFEDTLLAVRASTGATATQLEAVKAAAMATSAELGVGPTQATQGFLELLKAGMSLEDVLGGAGQTALQFAKVGQMEVAAAAVVMADAMKVFGVSSEVAANTLSAAADASSTSVEEMTMAFSQSSAVAALANQSIGDLSAALAILANNGVKGSDAGTSVKTMLMRLMAPADDAVGALNQIGLSVQSFRGADGQIKPMVEIIRTLNGAMAGMDQAARDDIFRRIFGQDAIRAAAILTSTGTEGFDAMRQAMGQALPVGQKFRDLMSGLSGAMATVRAAIERAEVAISNALQPTLMGLSASITGAISDFAKFAQDNPAFIATIAKSAVGAMAAGAAFVGLGSSLRIVSFAFGGFIGTAKAIVSPLVMASDAALYAGRSFSTASVQVAGFAAKGVAVIAQFAADTSARLAITAAKSGAITANYFAGTIAIISATVARAAEGNMRAAAVGVQAMGRLATSATQAAMIAGAQIARLSTTGGSQLLRLGVQGSGALAVVGASAAKAGTLTLASFAKSTAAALTYVTASVGGAAATAAAWAAANVPLLTFVGVIGGAVLVLAQVTSLAGVLGSAIKSGITQAVSEAVVVFGDLKRIAYTTFAAVSDALAAGDMALAMEAAMAGVLAAFQRGSNALMSKVEGTSANILNTLDAFQAYVAQPLMLIESIKDPFVEADRQALRKRQDERLNKVGANDITRAKSAAQAEAKVADLSLKAAAKRADAEQSRDVSERLGNSSSMQDVDLARQMIARLIEAGNLTAEAEQRLVDDYNARFSAMNALPQAGTVAATSDPSIGPAAVSAAVTELLAKIATSTDTRSLGKAGNAIDELLASTNVSDAEQKYLLDAYSTQLDRIATADAMRRGVDPQSTAEVAGTFSSVALGGMGFGSSLMERLADYGKRTAEATEQMAAQSAVVGE